MLLLPVCAAKILSKYLAALLPYHPQASSKSTTLQQLMSIFQHFSRISPFQHSVFKSNPAGTGLEKKKSNPYLIHHSGWLQTSVMSPIYSATDKRVVGNGQVPETESPEKHLFIYLFIMTARKLFVSIYFRLGSFHDHLSYLSLANTRGRFCSFVFVILRIHYYYYSVRSDLIKRCCKKVRWKKNQNEICCYFSYYLLTKQSRKKPHCFFIMSNPTDHCTFLSSSMLSFLPLCNLIGWYIFFPDTKI